MDEESRLERILYIGGFNVLKVGGFSHGILDRLIAGARGLLPHSIKIVKFPEVFL